MTPDEKLAELVRGLRAAKSVLRVLFPGDMDKDVSGWMDADKVLNDLHVAVVDALHCIQGRASGGGCPFCGKAKLKLREDDDGLCRVACSSCGATGPESMFIDTAEHLWNARNHKPRLEQ